MRAYRRAVTDEAVPAALPGARTPSVYVDHQAPPTGVAVDPTLRAVRLVARVELQPQDSWHRGTSFSVVESAVLSDGGEVVLLDDRGWGTSYEQQPGEPFALTADDIAQGVRNVVLPDDAEDSGEDHEWAWFVRRLRDVGVATTETELRGLPYDVVPGERLRATMQGQGRRS